MIDVSNGELKSYHSYENPATPKNVERDVKRLNQMLSLNEYLSEFTGKLEILMNSFEIKVIDVVDSPETRDMTCLSRIRFLIDNVKDNKVYVQLNIVDCVQSHVAVPTLYRCLDSTYNYGNDYLCSPIKKDRLFVVVGYCMENRETKIMVPKSGYDFLTKVPKVIRATFKGNLENINKWKDAMFADENIKKVIKNDAEFVEFEHNEKSKVYLVAGSCIENQDLKIFGKVKLPEKLGLKSEELSKSVFIEPYNNKLVINEPVFFKRGYVVSCLQPKIAQKSLCYVNVLECKRDVNLEDSIKVCNIDRIPLPKVQHIYKKLHLAPLNVLIDVVSDRMMEVSEWRNQAIQLQNIVDNISEVGEQQKVLTAAAASDSSSDSEDEEHQAKKRKM